MVFAEEAIDCFASASIAFPEVVVFEVKDPVAGFSTFYVNKPDVWLKIGGFDECLILLILRIIIVGIVCVL